MNDKTEQILEQAQETKPKKVKSKQPKIDSQTTNTVITHNYQVKVDIDKDLDLLLCCGLLNRRGIRASLHEDEILCGLYSNLNNAIIQKHKIEALGYKVTVTEV